jgi:archaellum biogenesis ATPase FlaH
MKRDVKKYHMGISDRFRRVLAQKEFQGNEFIQQLKRISKAGKVFVTTVKKVIQKRLCTAFCYNFYQLMTLEINLAFLRWLQLSLKSKHNEQKRKNRVKMQKFGRKIWVGLTMKKKLEINWNPCVFTILSIHNLL